ncbi:sugar phosphate nucleotidyltransferase [Halorutilales archaeon Cl-col2-1]
MKAVVLAGGYATRLWPITKNRAKPLLPLGGKPIVDYILDPLEDEDAVSEVFVSTNQRFADDFEEHIESEGYEKATVAVEPTTSEDEKLGTIGALADLVERESIDEDTVVIAGDNLFSFEVNDFIEFFDSKGSACIASYDVGSREDAKQYGLVDVEGGQVVDFQEKPDEPKSTLVSIACYAFPADTLRLLDEYLRGDNNPDAPGFFIEWLHTRENVYSYVFDGAWFDVGTPDSYLDANSYVLDGSVIEDGAVIENTQVGEDVYVMSGAEIHDSEIENSIVFENARIDDCTVRHSIVDRETVLDGVDFNNALVGEHSHLNSED